MQQYRYIWRMCSSRYFMLCPVIHGPSVNDPRLFVSLVVLF